MKETLLEVIHNLQQILREHDHKMASGALIGSAAQAILMETIEKIRKELS